jgi:hypothetical protein
MGVLLMLMTIGGVITALIVAVVALITKKSWLLKFTLAAVAVWFVFYAVMLIGFSAASKENVLGLNEAKAFCGFYLDCHMHTAVTGVRTTKQVGEREANGEFYIVTVKVFSDAKRAELGLLTVDAHVVDGRGGVYARDQLAENELPPQPPFEKKIGAAESVEKEIVFDLPADAVDPRLDIREGYGIDHLIEAVLVDDEDSILHKRTYFKLPEQTETAGVK